MMAQALSLWGVDAAMYRTVLKSGSGKNFVDVDGKSLVAIGNQSHAVGDAVWTDGKCIYGWVRESEPAAPMVFTNAEGVMLITVAGGAVWLSAWDVRKNTVKRLAKLDSSANSVQQYAIVADDTRQYLMYKWRFFDLATGDFVTNAPAPLSDGVQYIYADYALDKQGRVLSVLGEYQGGSSLYRYTNTSLTETATLSVRNVSGGSNRGILGYTRLPMIQSNGDFAFVGGASFPSRPSLTDSYIYTSKGGWKRYKGLSAVDFFVDDGFEIRIEGDVYENQYWKGRIDGYEYDEAENGVIHMVRELPKEGGNHELGGTIVMTQSQYGIHYIKNGRMVSPSASLPFFVNRKVAYADVETARNFAKNARHIVSHN